MTARAWAISIVALWAAWPALAQEPQGPEQAPDGSEVAQEAQAPAAGQEPEGPYPPSDGPIGYTAEEYAAIENDPERAYILLPGPPACRDQWRCPNPLKLDSAELAEADFIDPPDGPPPVIKKKGRNYRPVRVGRGYRAPDGSAPYMAQLQRPPRLPQITQRALGWDDRLACGGAVIKPGWVLTAAHCLVDQGSDIVAGGYRIRLGQSDIRNVQSGIGYRIVRTISHPEYNSKTYMNDIALIQYAPDDKTERDRRVWVQTVKIGPENPKTVPLNGKPAYFYGWGLTEGQSPSAPLLYGKVKIQPDSACAQSRIALCGLGLDAAGSTQCHGDSGGPLIWFDQRRPTLVGVVSHNVERAECGKQKQAGVFTRVASYREWIERYTGPLP